ncbi:hypothetical protein XaC1_482 [Xanthomonas phage XaC1]|nr:hypothetical protein XaC1_482 [Xanthomonas phage XaC1]
MIDANKVFRSLYKIRFTDMINRYRAGCVKEVDKLRKHRILNSKINNRLLSGIKFYYKFFNKLSNKSLAPVVVDDRKFCIDIYQNYSPNSYNKNLTLISITESRVYLEVLHEVIVSCADGLDDDEMFNAKLRCDVPDIVSKAEVLKLRKLIKDNKKYQCKKYLLYFDNDDNQVIPYFTRMSRLSKI